MNESEKTKLALLQKDIEYIKQQLIALDQKIDLFADYEVTKKRITFIEKIVYTTAGTVLLGFLSALVALVFA